MSMLLYVLATQRRASAKGRDVPIPMIILISPTQPNDLAYCLFLGFLFGLMHLKRLENRHFLASLSRKAALRTAAVRFSKQRNLNHFSDSFHFLFFFFSLVTPIVQLRQFP